MSTVFAGTKPSEFALSPRRAGFYDISDAIMKSSYRLPPGDLEFYESVDVAYRAICAILYNYVPLSGHPGGSISSGRIAQTLVFDGMDYDFSDPDRPDADLISYAAGHKALGLYALWALRNELARIGDKTLLPAEKHQLRLEDLIGFRRNPAAGTPLFKQFNSKPLDGHPTPVTPFIKLATGASGVGVGSSLGLALGAADIYRAAAPRVHIIEGEGGMTAGRAHEAFACAATTQLKNAVLHVDWNQASIDSEQVCPENGRPGDYVQWTPAELLYTHDWNVVSVPNGHDFFQIQAAQRLAAGMDNSQPTAIVYRTVKGWRYGIQGRAAHGAGHKFASDGFYAALDEFQKYYKTELPRFCGEPSPEGLEKCFWNTLSAIRKTLESRTDLCRLAAQKLQQSRRRLDAAARRPRADAPDLSKLYGGKLTPETRPASLKLEPGKPYTLRAELAACLGFINRETGGALLAASADLAGSTSISDAVKDFPAGFFNCVSNRDSRLVPVGGICEDAMGAVMGGVSSYGRHIGISSSYAAFIAALEHVPARLHAIAQQAENSRGLPRKTFIMVNAHSGAKTGEDGPTHADPQALQLLQENFPKGALITLTPWEQGEIWPLLAHSLLLRPAVIAPFVTRPAEIMPDRAALGMPPAQASVKGIYALHKAEKAEGTVVLQGSGVTLAFVSKVLPEIKKRGYALNVFYVSSAELFDLLPEAEKELLYPAELAGQAMGITDFTLPTMYPWIRSREGLRHTLHPFAKGHYLGSGQAEKVLEEGGLDAAGQLAEVQSYVETRRGKTGCWC
ncbi:MAG: hypothetical protein WC421_10695 [Elusimicrobiales bacterium]